MKPKKFTKKQRRNIAKQILQEWQAMRERVLRMAGILINVDVDSDSEAERQTILLNRMLALAQNDNVTKDAVKI